MAEHEVGPVDSQFGIMSDRLPIIGLRQRIVVAETGASCRSTGEDLGGKRGGAREIADVPDLILDADHRVPARNHRGAQ
jgi:hypothetical protein